jgi:anhydro-N-acetylmuramic acid kinase
LDYYKNAAPKSLDAGFFKTTLLPIILAFEPDPVNQSRTYYEHVAFQIMKTVENVKGEILVTGGGAYNDFLMHCLRSKYKLNVTIPSNKIVDFKEALIFGFMGVLKMRGEINCLASVTGSLNDQSTGEVNFP